MDEYRGIGNLTKDPVAGSKGDLQYCNFTIAINERNKTVYRDVSAFNKTAVACGNHLQKGSQVCVSGSPEIDVWTDKDGNAHGKVKIMANDVQFLSRIKGKEQSTDNIDRALKEKDQGTTQNNPSQQNQASR